MAHPQRYGLCIRPPPYAQPDTGHSMACWLGPGLSGVVWSPTVRREQYPPIVLTVVWSKVLGLYLWKGAPRFEGL